MNTIKINKLFVLAVVTVIAMLVPMMALGATMEAGEEVYINEIDNSEDNLYVAGGNVSVSSDVLGDVLAAGGNVSISGNVSEDIAVAGGSVTILGDTEGDVRVAGGNILIVGNVSGELVITGGSVMIAPDVLVKKDLIIAGGQIVIEGDVEGDVEVVGGVLTINGHLMGDVKARVEERITLGSSSVIDGNLAYSAKNTEVLKVNEGAVVNGETMSDIVVPTVDTDDAENILATIMGALVLLKFVVHLVVALVLVWLFRRFSNSVVSEALENPLSMLGKGFITLIVMPVAAILLLVTIIGVPLSLMTMLAYGLVVSITCIYAGIVAGAWLSKMIHKSEQIMITWGNVFMGVLLLTILGFIPFIGWIIGLLIFLVTFGSIVDMVQKKMWQGR